MAEPAYLKVTGAKQADITEGAGTMLSVGNMYTAAHPDESRIIEINHSLMIPKDPQSGQPTGQPVHEPVCITKLMDKASPLLANALIDGEDLTEVLVSFYRTSGTDFELYATWKLEQAKVVGIKPILPNILDPNMEQFGQMEQVYFSYGKISWDHVAGGTSGCGDFGSQ